MEQVPEVLLGKGIWVHLVTWLIYWFRVRAYIMLEIKQILECWRCCESADLSNVAKVANFQCCKCCSAFRLLQGCSVFRCCNIAKALKCSRMLQGSFYCGKLQMLQEKKCVCKYCRVYRCCSTFSVAEFAVALKIVAGVVELSKCCERAGFFRVLQYEFLIFF